MSEQKRFVDRAASRHDRPVWLSARPRTDMRWRLSRQCDELVIGALRVEAGEDLAIEAAILVSAYTGPDRISIARFAPRGHPAGYRIYSKLAPGPWFNSVSLRRCAWPWRSPCLRWLEFTVSRPRKQATPSGLVILRRCARPWRPPYLRWLKFA